MKSGIKTTEFWLCIYVILIGSMLLGKGYIEEGTLLISVATGTYGASRGIAKKK